MVSLFGGHIWGHIHSNVIKLIIMCPQNFGVNRLIDRKVGKTESPQTQCLRAFCVLAEPVGFDRQRRMLAACDLVRLRLTAAARAPKLPPEASLLARSPLGLESPTSFVTTQKRTPFQVSASVFWRSRWDSNPRGR